MKLLKNLLFAFGVLTAIAFFGSAESVKAQQSSMTWRGTVDDTIQVRIRNRNVRTQHISGREYFDSSYNFDGRAGRQGSRARVDKRDGRGRVQIIEQPSRRNNWTTVIQISDTKGGPDRYRFTVYWD
ncbi:MAG TPA: hypothetical protein PKY59_01300 [Pyrinomonadaceae bacterium]|nr:hypothetical protein [Pyrinomonadaceae bacterium]